jgi:peptidoglycan/LPS O-acetylase OafA/YrhL
MIFAGLLLIPVAVLLWRMIVSKQNWPVRLGAAGAAMLTVVGAATAVPRGFEVSGVREWTALALSATGPTYLLLWSLKHRGRKYSKTVSLIAAIIGFAPIIAVVGVTLAYAD